MMLSEVAPIIRSRSASISACVGCAAGAAAVFLLRVRLGLAAGSCPGAAAV
jgi:hypothetical protein